MKAILERAKKLKALHNKRDEKIKSIIAEIKSGPGIKRTNALKRAITELMNNTYTQDIQFRDLTHQEKTDIDNLKS